MLLMLGGGIKYFLCSSPTWGFMIQFDEHIFQMGWFNHQGYVKRSREKAAETVPRPGHWEDLQGAFRVDNMLPSWEIAFSPFFHSTFEDGFSFFFIRWGYDVSSLEG